MVDKPEIYHVRAAQRKNGIEAGEKYKYLALTLTLVDEIKGKEIQCPYWEVHCFHLALLLPGRGTF